MKLNANQIAFILAGLEFFDDDGDFEDGKYYLTEQECNETIQMLQTELEKMNLKPFKVFDTYSKETYTYTLNENGEWFSTKSNQVITESQALSAYRYCSSFHDDYDVEFL